MSSSLPTDGVAATLRRSLEALRRGDLAAWEPLPARAGREDLDAAAGPGREVDDLLFNAAAVRRTYPPAAGLPFGLEAWLQAGQLVLVEAREPHVGDVAAALGAPEAARPSGLGPGREQWLYPARGLVLHLDVTGERVFRLYGHEATTLAALEGAPLLEVRRERIRPRG